jgi:anti-sigma factor ChrR (cupin superfamily)
VEAHLRECTDCQAELRELREICGDLAAAAPVTPPPGLKDRLMSRIADAPRKPGVVFDGSGILLARSAELPWRELFPGVEGKLLHGDRERQYTTSLMRLAPGTKYPSHEHKDVEEIYVLSGDLQIEGVTAGPGDYCRAEAHTVHREAYTTNGCLFLVVASRHNRVLQ